MKYIFCIICCEIFYYKFVFIATRFNIFFSSLLQAKYQKKNFNCGLNNIVPKSRILLNTYFKYIRDIPILIVLYS